MPYFPPVVLRSGAIAAATVQAQEFTNGITINTATTFSNHSSQIVSESVSQGYYAYSYMDGVGGGAQNAFLRAAGTLAAPSATLINMTLGALSFRGYTGSGFTGSKGFISVVAEENWTATANGTRIEVHTTANGTTTLTRRLIIANDGNIGIGTLTNPSAALDLPAGSTARASLRIRTGSAPTSPNDGDLWYATRLNFRRGSTTERIPSGTKGAAFTRTYATADRVIGAYTADNESSAYTGIDNAQGGTVYATVDDLNALRVAYENLRAFVEDGIQALNAVIDDLQVFDISG